MVNNNFHTPWNIFTLNARFYAMSTYEIKKNFNFRRKFFRRFLLEPSPLPRGMAPCHPAENRTPTQI